MPAFGSAVGINSSSFGRWNQDRGVSQINVLTADAIELGGPHIRPGQAPHHRAINVIDRQGGRESYEPSRIRWR